MHRKTSYLLGAATIVFFAPLDWLVARNAFGELLVLRLLWAGLFVMVARVIESCSQRVQHALAVAATAVSGLCLAHLVHATGGATSPYVFGFPLAPLLLAQVEREVEAPTWTGGAFGLLGLGTSLLFDGNWTAPQAITLASSVAATTVWAIYGFRSVRKVRSTALEAARLAGLGRLAATAAHEIKNSLAAASANVDWLAQQSSDLPPSLRNPIREAVTDTALGLQRMQTIVEDLRTIARSAPQQGGIYRIADAVQEALRLCSTLRAAPNLHVRVEIDDALPCIRGDRGRVVQVLINLLANAAEALSATKDRRILVWAREENGRIVVAVDDNGPGMPRQVRERLFEPFLTTKDGGTGLGLPLAARFVREQGGTLTHEDLPGGGTRFRFDLPHVGAETEAGRAAA